MATYAVSVTTTAGQDVGLTRLLHKVNADRAAQVPPLQALADIPALLVFLMMGAAADYLLQYKGEIRNTIGPALDTATAAQLTSIATTLGITLPT